MRERRCSDLHGCSLKVTHLSACISSLSPSPGGVNLFRKSKCSTKVGVLYGEGADTVSKGVVLTQNAASPMRRQENLVISWALREGMSGMFSGQTAESLDRRQT